MRDWNTIITVHEGAFTRACHYLEQFGPVRKSGFYNVLLMRLNDPLEILRVIHEQLAHESEIAFWIARFMPVERTFTFNSPMEFEERAREAASFWLPSLAGSSFHLRMHRRGFKGRLSSADEERFLDQFLLERLSEAGAAGRIAFDNPDAIIALETLGTQAGLSLWERDDLKRFPLLHLD